MKKKFLSIMFIATMCISLAACGGKENKESSNTESSEQSTQKESESTTESEESVGNLSKSEQAAYDFISAIQKEDYEKVKEFLNVDTTYITKEDLEWLLPRTSYSDVVGNEMEIKDIVSSGGKTQDNISLKSGPASVSVNVELNNDNEWKVNCNEFYISDWKVKAPKGVTFKLGEVEAPKTLIESTDERWDTYSIPAVPIKEATLTFSSETFGDFELKTTPSTEEYKAILEFDEETANKIYEDVKKMMNDINAVYDSGKTETTDYKEFVSDLAAPDFINTLTDNVITQYTWNNSLNPKNIKVTQVLGRNDDEKTKPCFVYTTNTIAVNLRVEKKWEESHKDGSSTKVHGYFILEKTDDGVKLVNMDASNNPIKARNSMTRDW